MIFSAKDVMYNVASKSGVLKPISVKERERLQNVLVSMLADVQNASEKMGVEIVLCGGSCLGAVRHKGFIPWDEDVDISIMRADWEIFKAKFEELLGSKYELESPNYGDKDSKYPWSTIYLKGSEMQNLLDINLPYQKGIYIDVFVIENVSESKFIQEIDAFVSASMKYIANSMLFYKYPSKELHDYFCVTFKSAMYYRFRQILGCLFSFVSHKKLLEMYDKFISRHKQSSSKTTIPVGTKLYLGEMLDRRVWLPYKKARFGSLEVNIPQNAHLYLSNLYGSDYMTEPPKEKQVSHFIYSLKFPKGF